VCARARDRVRGHQPAAAQHAHLVGVGGDLAELVGDEHDAAIAGMRAVAQQPQHLVGFLRRQHRRGLVEDQEARLQQELLQDLELLLLPGRQLLRRRVEVEAKGRRGHEGSELGAHRGPVDQRRQVAACQQQVLGHRHAGHQREMLVHHADAEVARDHGRGDVVLAAVDQHAALLRALVADDTLHERALAGAVLAQQRMHGAGRDGERHLVEGGEAAEALGELVGGQCECAGRRRQRARQELGHASASMSAPELATAPNTPPCIVTIFSAAR